MTGGRVKSGLLYDAFISYATDPDYQLVRELEIFLETFHETPTPSEIELRPLQICVDGSDFTLPKTFPSEDPSAKLPAIVESYLSASRYVLVVSSRGARRSAWMRKEIEWFLANRSSQQILLAISEGKDPSRSPDEVFPEPIMQAGLNRRIWYDLRGYRREEAQRWRKVRNFDDNRVRLAADLQGVRASDVQPSWYRAKERAEEQERARRRVAASQNLALTAQSLVSRQLDLSLLLSVEALGLASTVEARNAVLEALERHPSLQASLHGHQSRVSAVVFLTGGQRLISAASDRLLLWDVASGAIVAEQPLTGGNWSPQLAVSADGRQVAVACADRCIRFFSTGDDLAGPVLQLSGHTGRIRSLAFSKSGKRLASCSFDKTIRIWDLRAKALLRQPIVEPASAVAFGLDDSKVLFARNDFNLISSELEDNGIYVLDVDSEETIGKPLLGHRSALNAIAVDEKRRLLISADGSAFLWSLVEREKLEPSLEAHDGTILSVAITGDGRIVATGSEDHTVQVWDTSRRAAAGERLRAHTKGVYAVCFDGDGRRLATGAEGGELLLWDLPKNSNLRVPFALHPEVSRAIFAPSGNQIASCGNDSENSVVVWDAWTGEQRALLLAHTDNVTDIAFHPSGEMLASCSWDNTVCRWSMERHELVSEPVETPGRANAVSFSPDGKQLAVAHGAEDKDGGGVLLLSVAEMQKVTVALDHDQEVTNLCFSPDGRMLVTATQGEVRIWEWLHHPARSRSVSCPGFVHAVTFSASGEILAAVTSHGLIHLWCLPSLEPYSDPLRAHTLPVFDLAFRPDGAMMATGAADSNVILWDVVTHTMIGAPARVNTESVVSVDFSSDGARLVTAGYDGLITLWDVSEASWAEKALLIANRNLSEAEQIGYLSDFESKPHIRKSGQITLLPMGIDLEKNRGRLRGKASEAWREFDRTRLEQRKQLDEAAVRVEEAAAFADRGESVEAVAAFDDAIAVYRELKGEWSIVPLKLASALQNRGDHQLDSGHLDEATASLSESSKIARIEFEAMTGRRRKSERPRPDTEEIRACRILALSESHLGLSLRLKGEARTALTHLSHAVELWEHLITMSPDLEDKHEMAWALNNRGVVHETLGDVEAASSDYAKAALLEKELLRGEETIDRLEYLIGTLRAYAGVVRRAGRPEEAARIYGELETYARRLFGDTGDVKALGSVATATRLRADCLHEVGDGAAAHAAYDEAVRLLSDLVKRGGADLRPDLASALKGRSLTNRDSGNLGEALFDSERSLAVWETDTSQSSCREDLAHAWMNRSYLLDEAGRIPEALSACDRAIEIQRGNQSDRHLLGLSLITQSRLRERCKDTQGSVASADEAVTLFEQLKRARVGLLSEEDLARAIARRAHAHEAVGEWTNAVVDYHRAIDCLDAALARLEHRQTHDLSEKLGQLANNLAWILATHPRPEIRDGDKALRLAQRACEITGFKTWEYLDTLAAAHARHGDFEKAREFLHKAMTLAPLGAQESLTRQLAAYEASEPFTNTIPVQH